MASIKQRNGSYQVVIRLGKYKDKPLYKSFDKKTLAVQWAKKKEAEIIEARDFDSRPLMDIRVTDLLTRFDDQYVSTLSASSQEVYGYIIKRMQHEFRNVSLANFDAVHIKQYIEKRLAGGYFLANGTQAKPIGVDAAIKELNVLTRLFQFCQMSWGLPVRQNEAKEARAMLTTTGRLNGANVMRVSRYSDKDYAAIRAYNPVSSRGQYSPAKYALLLAIESGMRRSEIVSLRWANINWAHGFCTLDKEKSDYKKRTNRKGRIVPLTPLALAILRMVRYMNRRYQKHTGDYVWSWSDPKAASKAVKRMMVKLGIEGMGLHDGRHDFGSRQADAEVDIRLSSAAMGHSDLRSIKRYTHPDMIKNAHKIKGR